MGAEAQGLTDGARECIIKALHDNSKSNPDGSGSGASMLPAHPQRWWSGVVLTLKGRMLQLSAILERVCPGM